MFYGKGIRQAADVPRSDAQQRRIRKAVPELRGISFKRRLARLLLVEELISPRRPLLARSGLVNQKPKVGPTVVVQQDADLSRPDKLPVNDGCEWWVPGKIELRNRSFERTVKPFLDLMVLILNGVPTIRLYVRRFDIEEEA
jgi:hypothetical protein